MTMNVFHVVKNAQSALKNIQESELVEIVSLDQTIREARVVFRFADDASISFIKGVDGNLTRSGWEEQSSESEHRSEVVYEIDMASTVKEYVKENYEPTED